MRRTEREVKDLNEIIGILERCDVIRLGLSGSDYPYVVPLSFGYEAADGKVVIYFHGAKDGFKHDLIASNNKVCVEADIFHQYTGTGHGVTADYESIIGFGTAEVVDDKEAVKGLELLLQHCNISGYNPAECIALGITRVYKITLDTITGKKNINKV